MIYGIKNEIQERLFLSINRKQTSSSRVTIHMLVRKRNLLEMFMPSMSTLQGQNELISLWREAFWTRITVNIIFFGSVLSQDESFSFFLFLEWVQERTLFVIFLPFQKCGGSLWPQKIAFSILFLLKAHFLKVFFRNPTKLTILLLLIYFDKNFEISQDHHYFLTFFCLFDSDIIAIFSPCH